MRVSQIKFKMNVSDPNDRFRHEHAEVTVEVGELEDAQHAIELARATAERGLGVDVDQDDIDAAEKLLARARKAGLR
jgi:hypothetical protein